MILFSSTSILEGEHLEGGQGPPTSFPLPPTSRQDLRLNEYLEYPHATKAVYIYKHPCLLPDLNPCPTTPQLEENIQEALYPTQDIPSCVNRIRPVSANEGLRYSQTIHLTYSSRRKRAADEKQNRSKQDPFPTPTRNQ
ncbi:hypothetical protein TNCV_494991 [Trichonephila clavipes]|nr:hypothetical protein TNCV_494991 [Trichonephila clavipes]